MLSTKSIIFAVKEKGILDYYLPLCGMVFIIGLFYSKFALSLSIIGFGLLIFIPFPSEAYKHRWTRLKRYFWIGPVIIYFGIVFSVVNTEDISGWLHHLRLKLPLLIVPISLAILPRLQADIIKAFMKIFIYVSALSTLSVLLYYILHFDTVNEGLGRGIPMPTPVNHIRYSLFLAFAAVSSFILFLADRKQSDWHCQLLPLVGLFIVVVLHLLAIRSGLLVFYTAAIVLALWFFLQQRKYASAVLGVIGILIIGVFGSLTIPSLKKKMGYMRYDLAQLFSERSTSYSDSERIVSLQIGWQLFMDQPILGTGIGDLKQSCAAQYSSKEIINLRARYPHNQYVFVAAGMGIVGLLFFLLGTIWPMYYFRKNHSQLLVLFYIIILISYLVENTIETSPGVSFYTVMLTAILLNIRASMESD